MRDDQTGSQWLHYTGECVLGPLAGKQLTMLSTNIFEWPAFRERYPTATVIANTPSLFRRLMGYFDSAREAPSFMRLPSWFTRTMRQSESSLPSFEFGLGVIVGQRSVMTGVRAHGVRFYPYKALKAAQLVQHELGGRPVIVWWDDAANSGVAFEASLNGAPVRVSRSGERLVDTQGNTYDHAGRAVSGPAEGKKLPLLPAIATRWYGFHQTYPNAEVFAP